MSVSGLVSVLGRFPGTRVLVLGDTILDAWLYGRARRLCREAPVPVVDVARVETAAGAAANTAVNAAALGGDVVYLSVTGTDPEGADLRRLLRAHGVDDGCLLSDPARATPVKRRLVCDDQLTARFDMGAGRWSADVLERLEEAALELAGEVDVVLVGDYDDGALTPRFRNRLAGVRDILRGPLVVDAHCVLRWRECRPTAVTPDADEALRILGEQPSPEEGRLGLLARSSAELLARTAASLVLTTADADGTLLHRPDLPPHRTRATRAAPQLTCGAGDTFAAAFALALGTGAAPEMAADLAQRAADVVVGRPGTAVCSAQDVMWRCAEPAPSTALGVDELAAQVRRHRAAGRRIVFTNGCFDLLHAGHAAYLRQARELGGVLVVGVNSDRGVRRLKGPGRPVVGEQERARLVVSLAAVDMVAIFDEDSPRELIEVVRPDVYVKGGDYTADMLPETELVRRLGGEVVIVGYLADHSTTKMVDRIRNLPEGEPASADSG